jgi:CHAD domain-containing protein
MKVVAERPVTAERIELDTFDGRLREHGLVAELAQDGGDPVVRFGGAVAPVADPDRVRAVDLPPGQVFDTLAPVIENRALLPGPRVRTRTLPLRVLNDDEKTVAKVQVEEAEVVRRGLATVPLRPRVQILEVRGYQTSRKRVERLLRDDLGLLEADERLSAEAVRALGGDPDGVSTKVDVDLTRDEPSSVALARVLLRLGDIVDANHAGTVDDLDPEFLHDLRVAIRRSRSMLREIKRVLPPEPRRRWRTELKWVQTVTGTARDLDVHLEDFEDYRHWLPQALEPDLAPLRELLERERANAVRSMRRALRSARYRDGWTAYRSHLERIRSGDDPIDPEAQPNANKPIGKVAAKRIRSVYRDMVERGSAIDDTTDPQALHDLRKRGKELRYLLEIFGDLYDPGEAQPMVKALKALQDTLGRHQDRHVQSDALRALGPDLAKLERGPAALMAMGLLVERLDGEQAAARAEFAERFAAFAAPKRQKAVKEVFR